MNAERSESIDHYSIDRLFRLARKELRETLRDRRTILTLVLMPLLVYPLLGLTFQRFLLTQSAIQQRAADGEYVIGFPTEDQAHRLAPLIGLADSVNDLPADDERRPSTSGDRSNAIFHGRWPADAEVDVPGLVEQGLADVGVRLNPSSEPERTELTLYFNPSLTTSVKARFELENRLRSLNELAYRDRLRKVNANDDPPIAVSIEQVQAQEAAAVTVAAVLPFILLLMTATGAVYPAIDLTAGERERGTLEALAAAPVSRRAVLAAKYIAVFTVAVLTAGMNLIAMTATAFSLGIDRLLFGGGFNANAISQVVALVLVLAAFFSAVLLLVTSFAKSFKEAQAYLIPVMLVSLAPGIVSMMPELQLTAGLAVTPLIGIVLLARDLMTTGASGLMIAACVVSTLLYATVALLLAARVFGTDAVLYGSEGTWTDLFRRPDELQAAPPLAVAAACLAAMFPGFLLLGPLPGRIEEIGIGARLTMSALLTALLFFVLPTIAAVASRSVLRSTFRLGGAPAAGWIGGALLGISLWPFAYEIALFASSGRLESLREIFKEVQSQLDAVPLWTKWLALAVVPAICEEWFFRGFLLSSLRTRVRDWQAVIATGLLFGAFHVIVRDSLFFERFFPSAFLGVILGAVCIRAGSIWPGMLLHVLHNGLLLAIAHYEQELIELGWSGGERTHLPWTWLATAALIAGVGAAAVYAAGRTTEMPDSRSADRAVGTLTNENQTTGE